ncbi:hypothetical protein HDV01_007082 [Terramyces sp. JEL0728]|nr:hypothetical protein HDV01_007082 [Terramyces sp. JEL0728]
MEGDLLKDLSQSALEKIEKQLSSIVPVKIKDATTLLHIKKDGNKVEKKASRTKVKIRPSDNLGAAPLPEGYISSLMAKQQADPKIIAPTSHAEKVRIAREKRPYVPKPQKKGAQNVLRAGGGEVWEDPTLVYWDDNDYRLFAGDLGNEVTDELLAKAFANYPSVLRTYVVRDKRSLKSKGYGFISFGDPDDYVKAMKEMNGSAELIIGKYVGNRPITLKRSSWKDRQADPENIARQKELAEVAKNPIKKQNTGARATGTKSRYMNSKQLESNILHEFPLDVKCILISKVNHFVLSPPANCNPSDILTSPAHVNFIMEFVGQGFNLPLENIKTISDGLNIYANWLQIPDSRPIVIKEFGFEADFTQKYFQTIFKHISLLFRARTALTKTKEAFDELNEHINEQISLCEKILSALRIFVQDNKSEITEETWMVLLKVLLGTGDTILKTPIQSKQLVTAGAKVPHEMSVEQVNSLIGDKLCEALIRVMIINKTIFHIWFESKLISIEMFDRLKVRDMIQNPVELESLNFQTAIYGLSKLVDEIHAFDVDIPEKITITESIVNGNTLLRMFGEWLFDAAAASKPGYEAGRAEALAVLCRIFNKLQRYEKFHDPYLEKFYVVLQKGLKADYLSLTSIILNSSRLFSNELSGFGMLFPDYIQALSRIIPIVQAAPQDFFGQKIDLDELRRGAYVVLSAMVFSLDGFKFIEIDHLPYQPQSSALSAQFVTMAQDLYKFDHESTLKENVLILFLEALVSEPNIKNCRYILNLISCYAVHESKNNPDIYVVFIKIIQEKLMLSDHWSQEIILAAFDLLSLFSVNMPIENESCQKCARDLTISICHYVEQLLKSDNLVPIQSRIVRAFDLIAKWSLLGDWIQEDSGAKKIVISALVRGVTILDRENPYSMVTPRSTEPPEVQNKYLSAVTMAALSKLSDSFKAEGPSYNQSSFSNTINGFLQTNSAVNSSRIKKPLPRGNPTTKKFGRLRLSYQNSGINMVSTGSKDGGFGLPTFAVLSTEIQIKSAAESALSLLYIRLGNFPPKMSCLGTTQLNSAWDEYKESKRLANARQALQTTFPDEPKSMSDSNGMIRYFAFQKRLLLGFVERPQWDKGYTTNHSPTIAVSFRDSNGYFSWLGEFQYLNTNPEVNIRHSNYCSPTTLEPAQLPESEPVETESKVVIAKSHFAPTHYPTILNASAIIELNSVNEANVPVVDTCFKSIPDLASATNYFDIINSASEFERILPGNEKASVATPHPVVNAISNSFIPQTYRFFMATIGVLDYQPNYNLILSPLPITNHFLTDLRKLDKISERDCYSISVLCCNSGDDSLSLILESLDSISKEYEKFLWSLGSPIHLHSHLGYRGNLDSNICPVAPYFSNINMQVIFNAPYLFKKDVIGNRQFSWKKFHKGLVSAESGGSVDDLTKTQTSENYKRPRAQTVLINPQSEAGKDTFEWVLERDSVIILWTEDLHNILAFCQDLPANIIAILVVHPLINTKGLFTIKIIGRPGVLEENAGPLLDDNVIAEESLATLVRHTAVNIYKSNLISKNGYRRPNMARRQAIEELCNKHIGQNGIYANLFTK